MRKSFLAVALLSIGCASANQSGSVDMSVSVMDQLLPVTQVLVVNSCVNSTAYIRAPGEREIALAGGQDTTIRIENRSSTRSINRILQARVVGRKGEWYGVAQKSVYVSPRQTRDMSWVIRPTGGNERCPR